jgi:Polyketide cyclase / dehydrase and lipid transport
MTHVEGEIIINRPVEDVFDFVADERNEPLYNREMLRCELISGEPIGVGSRFHAEMSMRGKPLEMTIEFTDFQRPVHLGSSTHLSTMEIEGMLTFERVPDGTRMRWFWDLHPRGVLKFLTPLVTYMGRRQEETIWTGLKRHLEGREVLTPSPS